MMNHMSPTLLFRIPQGLKASVCNVRAHDRLWTARVARGGVFIFCMCRS